MFLYKCLTLTFISFILVTVNTQDAVITNLLTGGYTRAENIEADILLMEHKLRALQDKVDIKIYYECHCSDCILFDTTQLRPTVELLGSKLNLHLNPYGNAETIDNGNGKYEFKCQHGPTECYGNKLHACAIDLLGNQTLAVMYNSCMMNSNRKDKGSDDNAADECGKLLKINSKPIKQCAKGLKGSLLLKAYGDESKRVGFKFVPYILINGVQNDGSHFKRDVCAAFANPPPECSK
ncbi:GILT-like protein 2 isoform X2 [Trichoplusia ni]|uniref:GILT-like protein 2 isoform X2 n=1 Tax=Trichoplusia ni TaxID=7111 RepID=A0A7E5VV88_TRINI|nr:GILT-like protein 2 isoform X2 [Trichoplusia ni]